MPSAALMSSPTRDCLQARFYSRLSPCCSCQPACHPSSATLGSCWTAHRHMVFVLSIVTGCISCPLPGWAVWVRNILTHPQSGWRAVLQLALQLALHFMRLCISSQDSADCRVMTTKLLSMADTDCKAFSDVRHGPLNGLGPLTCTAVPHKAGHLISAVACVLQDSSLLDCLKLAMYTS